VSARVLVTGATGFLGKAVLRRLGARGIGQGRNPSQCAQLSAEGLEVLEWTLPGLPPDCASLAQVDAIVHCAGLSSPFGRLEAFHAANVRGTQSILEFARAQGVKRFVFISSPSIYFALADQLNVSEEMTLPPPFTPYAQTKVAAERLVEQAAEVGPIILRPRGIYGPGDRALLPRLLNAARTRALPRFRQGRARIDLTFVDDVVTAVLAALDAGPDLHGMAFNVSGGEVLPIADIVEKACHRAGITPRWRSMPLTPALWAAQIAEALALMRREPREPVVTRYGLGLFAFEQSLDIARARDMLNWEPKVRFSDGLDRVFNHALAQ